MNAHKGQHQRNEFKEKGTFCNVAVFLQCLIQPLHSDKIEHNCCTADEIQRLVLCHFRDKKQCPEKYSVYDH